MVLIHTGGGGPDPNSGAQTRPSLTHIPNGLGGSPTAIPLNTELRDLV